jgi:hypothetical protein
MRTALIATRRPKLGQRAFAFEIPAIGKLRHSYKRPPFEGLLSGDSRFLVRRQHLSLP